MKVLVTGANGEVGRVIAPGLAHYDLTLTDRDTLDVTDARAARDAVADCDVVIHLATVPASVVWTSDEVDAAVEAIRVNNGGTYNVLRAAADFGKRAICASSCLAAYYNSLGQYVTEDYRPSGGGLYGACKVFAENMCRELHDDLGARMTVVRIGGFKHFRDFFVDGVYASGDDLMEHEAWFGSEDDLRDAFTAIVSEPSPDWSFVHVPGETAARRWELEKLWLNHRFRPRWQLSAMAKGRYDDREELAADGVALVDAAIMDSVQSVGEPTAANSLALRWACSLGHIEATEMLLRAGADANAFIGDPLRQAAASGNCQVFAAVLDAGADVEIDGGEAIGWAAAHGHDHIVALMLKMSGVTAKQKSCAVYQAAKANRVDIMRSLLSAGADPNIGKGETLRYAIWGNNRPKAGNAEMARLLLEHGLKQRRREPPYPQVWPLCEAIQAHGQADVVRALLDYGADPDDLLTDAGVDGYVASAVGNGWVDVLSLIGRDAQGRKLRT